MRSILIAVLTVVFWASAQTAPGFSLPDLTGDTVSLADFKEKIVVLDFWVMWCEECRRELPKLQRIHEKYGPAGVKVVGIHLEEKDPAKIRQFVKNAGITYPILFDPEELSADTFAIPGTPSIYLIDRQGAIIRKYRELNKKQEKEVYRIIDSLAVVN